MTDRTTSSAEIYGLGDGTLNSGTVGANVVGRTLPAMDSNGTLLANAAAALVRIHSVSGSNYNQNFNSTDKGGGNFDMLVMLNLKTNPLGSPGLGVDGALQGLLVAPFPARICSPAIRAKFWAAVTLQDALGFT